MSESVPNSIAAFRSVADHEFDVLPEGVCSCDETELHDCFVRDFPASATRAKIFDGFCRLRRDAEGHRISGMQWVDGSFVESKLDPQDIDVVTFCDYELLTRLDGSAQEFVNLCLNGRERTKENYRSHTFLVIACPAAHADFAVFEQFRQYWRSWFAKIRHLASRKGFLEMTFGDVGQVPMISREETS